MVNVNIDNELYEEIKKLTKKNKYFYPSIKFFIQKAVFNELLKSKNNNHNSDVFYSKVKEIIKDNPELASKIL